MSNTGMSQNAALKEFWDKELVAWGTRPKYSFNSSRIMLDRTVKDLRNWRVLDIGGG